MTNLENRIRESLSELVNAYEPRHAEPSAMSAAAPDSRSGRTITIAAALVGVAVIAAAVVVRFAGPDSITRLETKAGPTTIVPVESPAPEATEIPSSAPPTYPSLPPGSVSDPSQQTEPSEPQSSSQPLKAAAPASCAFEYREATLSQRGFAFDGTVLSIGNPPLSSGSPDLFVPVQFAVSQWFKGDGPDTFTVQMSPPIAVTSVDQSALSPQWGVGSRLLISGESQYGAGVLVDPVAWMCGFSRTYDSSTASQWRDVFADRVAPTTPSMPPEASAGVSPATLITRPYIDPSICADGTKAIYESPGSSNGPIYPFAHGREAPIPIQIIGNPAGGPAQPFAVLIRYFATANRGTGEIVTINGIAVGVSTFDNGNGQAQWTLSDGSNAYMRTRGLDKAAIVAIVRALIPRARTAPIPGFDYQPGETDTMGLTLIAETLNTDFVAGPAVDRFTCTTANGYIYRVDVLDGNPANIYLGVIDRSPPLHVANNGNGAVIISGLAAPTAPGIADVVNADQSIWDQLPTSPG